MATYWKLQIEKLRLRLYIIFMIYLNIDLKFYDSKNGLGFKVNR